MLLSGMLKKFVQVGTLHIIDVNGAMHTFRGPQTGPEVTVRFHNRTIEWRFLTDASMALGEGYMDQSWTMEHGEMIEFLTLIGRNIEVAGKPAGYALPQIMRYPLRKLQQYNPLKRARQNVAHHYDLSDALYDLFLDRDRHYSCAYYRHGNDSLDIAQENKKRLIARKLRLQPGHKVLEVGCGWGGMALFLAREFDVTVTGLTLSKEQYDLACARAEEAGLSDRVRFFLRDYREQDGQFDRIVSIGMFEHVGVTHYGTFFRTLSNRLKSDGLAVLHTIGRMEKPSVTDPWIRKYIFPGAYPPALSEVASAVEQTNMWFTDIEVLRLHYARTLHDWRLRFMANVDKASSLYDEKFCRMWEYYLAISEISFRHLRNLVFQFQISHRPDAAPVTRDYLFDNLVR